jgi:type II secretory pathway predicted ATPase ExeA
VLTGEVSAGRTVAARAALAALDTSHHTVVHLPNPTIGSRGLRIHLVWALGHTPRFHTASLIAQTADLLAAEHDERGKAVVLVVDEADLRSADQLEQLRLITNADMDRRSPLACLLIGQPTLRRSIKLGALAVLDQRVALRCHLAGMDLAETIDCIKHHLRLAGRSDQLFSDDAVALIHQTARGIPRAVDNLAVQALIAAYVDSKDDMCRDPLRFGHDGRAVGPMGRSCIEEVPDEHGRWIGRAPRTDHV